MFMILLIEIHLHNYSYRYWCGILVCAKRDLEEDRKVSFEEAKVINYCIEIFI